MRERVSLSAHSVNGTSTEVAPHNYMIPFEMALLQKVYLDSAT